MPTTSSAASTRRASSRNECSAPRASSACGPRTPAHRHCPDGRADPSSRTPAAVRLQQTARATPPTGVLLSVFGVAILGNGCRLGASAARGRRRARAGISPRWAVRCGAGRVGWDLRRYLRTGVAEDDDDDNDVRRLRSGMAARKRPNDRSALLVLCRAYCRKARSSGSRGSAGGRARLRQGGRGDDVGADDTGSGLPDPLRDLPGGIFRRSEPLTCPRKR